MGNHIRRWVDRSIWGKSVVRCEECGRELPAHEAVWRGRHAFCSIEHEAADAAEGSSAAPLDADDADPVLVGPFAATR